MNILSIIVYRIYYFINIIILEVFLIYFCLKKMFDKHRRSKVNVSLKPVMIGIDLPTVIKTAVIPGDDKESLFVATQPGIILIRRMGSTITFLDITNKVLDSTSNREIPDERGLLGMAFHPKFSENGKYYLHYSERNSSGIRVDAMMPRYNDFRTKCQQWNNRKTHYDHIDTIQEWKLKDDKSTLKRTYLRIKQPFANHNGINTLTWSPELNTLLVSLGDGGFAYDPFNLSQNPNDVYGKIISVNVNKYKPKCDIEPITRFSELHHEAKKYIGPLAKGLRNPAGIDHIRIGKRFLKYLIDVGQNVTEEINAFYDFGENFGWRSWEGAIPTSQPISGPLPQQNSSKTNESRKVHMVNVGTMETLTYSPSNLRVNVGDRVIFVFQTGPHSVTQSSSSNSCITMSNGFNSGVKSAGTMYALDITRNLPSNVYYHCTVENHCRLGMKGHINIQNCTPIPPSPVNNSLAIMYFNEVQKTLSTYKPFITMFHNETRPHKKSIIALTGGKFYKGEIPELHDTFIYADLSGSLFYTIANIDEPQQNQKHYEISVHNKCSDSKFFTTVGINRDRKVLLLGTHSSGIVGHKHRGAVYMVVPYNKNDTSTTESDSSSDSEYYTSSSELEYYTSDTTHTDKDSEYYTSDSEYYTSTDSDDNSTSKSSCSNTEIETGNDVLDHLTGGKYTDS